MFRTRRPGRQSHAVSNEARAGGGDAFIKKIFVTSPNGATRTKTYKAQHDVNLAHTLGANGEFGTLDSYHSD